EEDAVYDELARIAQGILLNIDNSLLTQCQNALDKAMVKVCGDTDSCDGIAVDSGTGERSFKYQVCQYTSDNSNNITWNGVCRDSLDGVSKEELTDGNWAGKLSGTMYWGDISYSCNTNDDNKEECSFTTEEEYINALEDAGYVIDEETKKVIKERVFGMEIRSLVNSVNMTIDTIESDPMVQYCMTGRKVQGLVRSNESIQEIGRGTARFPYLTQQMRKTIALHALKNAREAYNVKYDTELTRMMKDQVKAAQRLDETKAIQAAESACKAWAENSALPQSKAPKTSNAGKWIAFGLLIAAAVVAAVFTAGAGGVALGTAAMAVVGSVGIGSLGAGIGVVADISSKPVGEANIEQWNYKENITTTFQPSTGVCTKVRVYQNCEKTKKNYCEKWMEPVEVRDKVNLL
ncbi:MAG: hypothetical protein R8N24_01290, partial [Alphaproteobacteria bacterium]|nr:hypothetical protein [Alphaproteobacteria bacterium]